MKQSKGAKDKPKNEKDKDSKRRYNPSAT